jgi:hypothetical protein
MKLQHIGLLLLIPGVGAGCVYGARIPPEQIASSEAAIRAADEAGAEREPKAALHQKYARDELAAARALESQGRTSEASRLLLRSTADADLALLMTRGVKARAEAQHSIDEVRKLEQDTNQGPKAAPAPSGTPPSEPGTTGSSGDQPEPAPRDPD